MQDAGRRHRPRHGPVRRAPAGAGVGQRRQPLRSRPSWACQAPLSRLTAGCAMQMTRAGHLEPAARPARPVLHACGRCKDAIIVVVVLLDGWGLPAKPSGRTHAATQNNSAGDGEGVRGLRPAANMHVHPANNNVELFAPLSPIITTWACAFPGGHTASPLLAFSLPAHVLRQANSLTIPHTPGLRRVLRKTTAPIQSNAEQPWARWRPRGRRRQGRHEPRDAAVLCKGLWCEVRRRETYPPAPRGAGAAAVFTCWRCPCRMCGGRRDAWRNCAPCCPPTGATAVPFSCMAMPRMVHAGRAMQVGGPSASNAAADQPCRSAQRVCSGRR